MNEITGLNLKDIIFDDIEKFQGIIEYDFYLVNLIGVTKTNSKEKIFVKSIKKGKIKESLFCICDLAYEEYFNNIISKEGLEKPKKISILEEKENIKHTNKVSVNLFENNLNTEKVNIEIYFIEISKIIEQIKKKKNKWKGRENYIEINHSDILIIGVKNKH